mgnify:CR=1 FL=1
MTDALPAWDEPVIPIKIKPTCAIDEKARNRFKLFWRMAKRFPVTIVSTDRTYNILYQVAAMGLKTVYRTVANTNTTAAFEITEK